MSNIVLQVKELNVDRERREVLRDVSFSLNVGSNTALIGPNGAGKSTLIQAILGILPRRSGEVRILDQPLQRNGTLAMATRQQIAYLPQNFLFDRRIPMTVKELVGLGWDRLGWQLPWSRTRERRFAVKQALTRVGAEHLLDRALGCLSGGETKRVLLAYCLVRPRQLLILDEAPAGLDIQGEAEFYYLLSELKKEQEWAILQISHDFDMVLRQCDRVLCLNRTLLCEGSPEFALSTDNLVTAYGADFARYHHSCER